MGIATDGFGFMLALGDLVLIPPIYQVQRALPGIVVEYPVGFSNASIKDTGSRLGECWH